MSRSSTTCRGRREPPGPPRGLHPARRDPAGVGAAGTEEVATARDRRRWLFLRSGPARRTTSKPAASSVERRRRVPDLMFHFLPLAIRYDGSQPTAKHGYQVHVGPMYSDVRGSVKITSADPRVHPALRFNYLSTPNDRKSGSRRSRPPARSSSSRPSRRTTEVRRHRGRRCRATRNSSTGLPGTPRPRSTPRARRHGCRRRPRDDARRRSRRHPGRGRLRFPFRPQREHLRSRHDGRREGGRPSPRGHAPRAASHRLLRHAEQLRVAQLLAAIGARTPAPERRGDLVTGARGGSRGASAAMRRRCRRRRAHCSRTARRARGRWTPRPTRHSWPTGTRRRAPRRAHPRGDRAPRRRVWSTRASRRRRREHERRRSAGAAAKLGRAAAGVAIDLAAWTARDLVPRPT